ncbi:MAG TPA: type 4a pilus biogenesis protein PilO [Gaiellaceae bacterium]|nr:type 4a pilus biogenesis protein PilO [Gaiellaceae bacterium]
MKRLRRSGRATVALVVAGNVVLLALGWFFLIAPQRHQASNAAAELGATQAAIVRAQAPVPPPAVPSRPVQPTIRTADLYRLAKAMPSTADMPDLLLELDQVSRAAGVSVVSIAPGTPTSTTGTDYGVLPISLTFSGDFYSLTDLLFRLQRLVDVRHGDLDARGRLFSVSSVALTPSGVGRTLSATATLDAYVYGAAPAGSATTTGTTSTGTTGTTTTTTSTSSGA